MLGKLICYFKGHKRRRRENKDTGPVLVCPRCGDEKAVKEKK